MANVGKVVQVIGPVLDVEFEPEHLPEIYNALDDQRLKSEGGDDDQPRGRGSAAAHWPGSGPGRLHVVHGRRHCAAWTCHGHRSIHHRARGGSCALGRILNVLGEPVDEAGTGGWRRGMPSVGPSTAKHPHFHALEPKTEIFETGIKVIDLLALRT